ncbi:ferritin-like domain-containing protein [Rhizosaccharibacter radicis]|uniref:Ferritin-like domain-containing protein n=1 Tax=Rhizosaccharibacter radicis TaxID=2782605 RepID=A0ABT1W0L4_9PROT|nr:ferritin-like domain-containing protein [Acetobacteraceae bacterium KSS12]
MGFFTKPIKTLDDLLLHLLQDIYYAEQQITKALPRMIEKSGDPAVRSAFEAHLRETETQIGRLEQAFRLHGSEAKGATCQAIDGIIKEANEVASDVDDPEVLQVALVGSAQAVEHYEIARYGTIIAIATQLGRTDIADALRPTLDEEKATDRKLSALAEERVNRQAAPVQEPV